MGVAGGVGAGLGFVEEAPVQEHGGTLGGGQRATLRRLEPGLDGVCDHLAERVRGTHHRGPRVLVVRRVGSVRPADRLVFVLLVEPDDGHVVGEAGDVGRLHDRVHTREHRLGLFDDRCERFRASLREQRVEHVQATREVFGRHDSALGAEGCGKGQENHQRDSAVQVWRSLLHLNVTVPPDLTSMASTGSSRP